MRSRIKTWLPILISALLIIVAGNSLFVSAQDDANVMLDCGNLPEETVEIQHAYLYIENNHTDDDIGVHGLFDDHGWSELCVFDPNGELVLTVNPQAQLKGLTMAGIFFESREPPGDEYSFDDLKSDFPEGQYEVRGINFDGTALTGAATFSHNVPAPPVIVSPPTVEDEDEAEGNILPLGNIVVEWDDVTQTIDGMPVTITGYEVIITDDAYEDLNGFSQPIFDVHVPADRNALSVPVEFFEPNTLYELEILALEESGNQTISIGWFMTGE